MKVRESLSEEVSLSRDLTKDGKQAMQRIRAALSRQREGQGTGKRIKLKGLKCLEWLEKKGGEV